VFVIHEGDIVNKSWQEYQWVNANNSLCILDGVVPYILSIGNHDWNDFYSQYFPPSRYEHEESYGGHFGVLFQNRFAFFSAGGMKFMIISLEFGPSDEVLEWASEIVSKNRDRRVIVVTHAYMNNDDTRLGTEDRGNPHQDERTRDGNDGEEIWDEFVKFHPNIFLVLSGHILGGGVGRLTSIAVEGNEVHQLLANYQAGTPGRAGSWLRVMKLVPGENKIYVSTYSPNFDAFLNDSENEFVLDYNMSSKQAHKSPGDTSTNAGEVGQGILWARQFGSPSGDAATGVEVDSAGNVYLVGRTWGALRGQSHLGFGDAFVRKYDSKGSELWTRQFGTHNSDDALDVAIDGAGNVYVVGGTRDALPGQTHLGQRDAFVRKYDSDGNELWTRQFGTKGNDNASGIVIDGVGNVYVVGGTERALPGQTQLDWRDAFVREYDSDGNEIWTRQFGTLPFDDALDVAVDGPGNVYVLGDTAGGFPDQTNPGDRDAFVRKYDSDGNELWTRQLGSPGRDRGRGVGVDGSGNLYVVGEAFGAFPGQARLGLYDAFVLKYDSDGNELWTRQFGTQGNDAALGIAIDAADNVYVVGQADGILPGQASLGFEDAFVHAYDSDGNELWTRQFGTERTDLAIGVKSNGAGSLYVVGQTWGDFTGQTNLEGLADFFLVKMSVILP